MLNVPAASGALYLDGQEMGGEIRGTDYQINFRMSRIECSQLNDGYLAATGVVREQGYNAFGEIAYQTANFAAGASDSEKLVTNFVYDTCGKLLAKYDPTVSVTHEDGSTMEERPVTRYFYDQFGNARHASIINFPELFIERFNNIWP